MLDRQHLSILREVDRLGSLTAAAEQLNVTQSALSHTIRKLEERYGVAMWEKDGRNLRLTEAGRYLVTLSQRVLPQIERAEDILSDYRYGKRGSLKIGMECHPCHQWLMGVTKPYLVEWPDVDLALTTSFTSGGVAAGRGVSAIPSWLVCQQAETLGVRPVRIGKTGIHKSIHLGLRTGDEAVDFIAGFLATSHEIKA